MTTTFPNFHRPSFIPFPKRFSHYLWNIDGSMWPAKNLAESHEHGWLIHTWLRFLMSIAWGFKAALTNRGLFNWVVSTNVRSVDLVRLGSTPPEMHLENLTSLAGYIICLEHYGRPALKAEFDIRCWFTGRTLLLTNNLEKSRSYT